MNIISLTDVGLSVGAGHLFDEVTVGIEQGEKIGLVGRNGSGKSTLLRLLTGETEPEDGSVVSARGLRVATLEQRPAAVAGWTIADLLHHAFGQADSAGTGVGAGAGSRAGVGTGAGAGAPAVEPEEHAAALQRFTAVCDQLGLADIDAPLQTLSGGMMKKAALARAMALSSDFLVLDEPTNHLDIDAVIWLEQRLKSLSDGFILVTHDRYILDAVCTTIFEIDRRAVHRYEGNYSTYLERRAERENRIAGAEQRRVSILRTELQWLSRGAKARTGKDKHRKQRIDRMLDAGPEEQTRLEALPASQRRLGKKALELHDVAKQYDGNTVISPFSFVVSPGDRIGIIGPNGSGKSTLLDLLSGRVQPDAGTVVAGETTALAYFDQTGSSIDESQSVLEYMKELAERVRIDSDTTVSVEQFLERFLFPRSMFQQALGKLSGGEFRRLYLVRLLATSPNILLLDEPTNDLDIETLRIFEQYLDDFAGCILLVSHDRALLDRVTDSLLVFDHRGGITPFVGNYDAYRRSTESSATVEQPAAGAGAKSTAAATGDRPRTRKRGLSFREQREYERLPDEIEADETEAAGLEAAFGESVQDPQKLAERTRRYHELLAEVERKTARWEELGERADE